MSFGERLKIARENMGYTKTKLAEFLGYGVSTVSEYERGNNKPNLDTFIQICKLLKRDANYFLQDNISGIEPKLNPDDQYIIDCYKSLTPHDKEIVDHIFNMKPEELSKIYYFPIFYQSAAAGIGKLSETNDYQMEEFKLKTVPKKAVFGMYIKGHSMETIIYENDIVLIDPSVKNPSSLDDEIVVARFGEELICKRLSVNEDNQTYDFNSDNSSDQDKGRFNQKQNDFTLVGKVVKIIHAHEIGIGIFSYSED